MPVSKMELVMCSHLWPYSSSVLCRKYHRLYQTSDRGQVEDAVEKAMKEQRVMILSMVAAFLVLLFAGMRPFQVLCKR